MRDDLEENGDSTIGVLKFLQARSWNRLNGFNYRLPYGFRILRLRS